MLMGVRRDFSRGGGNVDISLILFQIANDAMEMDIYKMLYPFNTVKKVPHESTPMRCIRVCEKFALFVILHSICWIRLSPDIIIIVNGKQLSMNWTWIIHNYVYGARISLCELNLTSQNLVWNVFYTLAIRNAFSFHKLVISIFRALSKKKS